MDIPEIDVEAAATHLAAGDTTFMDVRDPASHAAGHVPGSLLVDDSTIGAFLKQHDKAARVIVYCYHGNASRGGTAYLMEHGFTNVASLRGGFSAWAVSQPCVRG